MISPKSFKVFHGNWGSHVGCGSTSGSNYGEHTQIAKFMGPTWGPTGSWWAPCWSHEPCYQGYGLMDHKNLQRYDVITTTKQNKANQNHEHIWWILHFKLLIHRPLGDVIVILKVQFSNICYTESSQTLIVKSLSGECHRTHDCGRDCVMISQHWFR